MQSITEREPLVEGFYGEYREPASELCVKMQRGTSVNGEKANCRLLRLIRVVPPEYFGPFFGGMKGRWFFYSLYKQK